MYADEELRSDTQRPRHGSAPYFRTQQYRRYTTPPSTATLRQQYINLVDFGLTGRSQARIMPVIVSNADTESSC
jgi:hypothetical protein